MTDYLQLFCFTALLNFLSMEDIKMKFTLVCECIKCKSTTSVNFNEDDVSVNSWEYPEDGLKGYEVAIHNVTCSVCKEQQSVILTKSDW